MRRTRPAIPLLASLLALGAMLTLWVAQPRSQTQPPAPAQAPAQAQRQPQPLLDVERLVEQGLAPGQRQHRFVESLQLLFRQLDADRDDAITESDRQLNRQNLAAMQRSQIVAQLLYADFDGDGVVTREELQQSIAYTTRISRHAGPPGAAERREQGLANWLASQMRADRNGDGRIDWAEMAAHARRTAVANPVSSFDPAYQAMLAFDANGDGRITPAEFTAGLEKRFAEFDTDDDGIISREEFEAYWQRAGRPAPQVASIQPSFEETRAEQCKLPRAPKDARIVVFNGYEFQGLSSVAVGSQDEITKATRVIVEPSPEPLYLLLIGWHRVIWQFEGALERVARVVLASVTPYDGKATPVGVTGLRKELVTFAGAGNCSHFWVNMNTKYPEQTKNSMRLLAGRIPDAVIDRQEVWNLRLPSGQISRPTDDERRRGIPSTGAGGPDVSRLSEKLLTYTPGGMVRIDPAQVIAGQEASAYELVPEYAGLIQLMQAGAIEMGRGDEIRVRRQIKIPPGLAGALSERFVVLNGVPPPTGSPGHSTVVSEDGALLCRGDSCRPARN